MELKGKIAILTGAASGIGRATAVELARHGCTLVLVDIQDRKLADALQEVRRHSPDSTAEVCDITDKAQVTGMVREIRQRLGRIDVLINNAGIMIVKPFLDLCQEEADRMMAVNFYAAQSLIRDVVPIMEEQGRGVIMNVASVGGKLIVPGTTVYAASKAAIYAFSEALYYELKDKGIHVGLIVPGGVRTGIFDSVSSKLGEYYRDQCTTSPSKVTGGIRRAIERERFVTVVPSSARLLLAAHDLLPGVFRRSLLSRLRPYFG